MEHFNNLTPDRAERLAILSEELGEAIQIIGKIQRHGIASRNPLVENSATNKERLEEELGDIYFIVRLMCRVGDISFAEIMRHSAVKHRTIQPWLHHNTLN